MENAFVLHRRKYRESSLIIEFLTEERGRIAAVAKGATRPRSKVGQILQPAIALTIETRGRSELQTLASAERKEGQLTLTAESLYAVLYMNEIVIKLTGHDDPLPPLFVAYSNSLIKIAEGAPLGPILRDFECRLLSAIGLGLNLNSTADNGESIESNKHYIYVADLGAVRYPTDLVGLRVLGASIKALNNECEWTKKTTQEAKDLMRYMIDYHLGGEKVVSRQIYAFQFRSQKHNKFQDKSKKRSKDDS